MFSFHSESESHWYGGSETHGANTQNQGLGLSWYLSGRSFPFTVTGGMGGNLVPAFKNKKELICHVVPPEKWQDRSGSPLSLHLPQKETVVSQF